MKQSERKKCYIKSSGKQNRTEREIKSGRYYQSSIFRIVQNVGCIYIDRHWHTPLFHCYFFHCWHQKNALRPTDLSSSNYLWHSSTSRTLRGQHVHTLLRLTENATVIITQNCCSLHRNTSIDRQLLLLPLKL